jgi:alpha-L-fucosidase 2
MAFGLVQVGLAAAHLGLAEEAYATVRAMSRYWRPNLVSTHNLGALFNTDICGGLPAVVLAMLGTSAHGTVRLLPALPTAWPAGEVTGLALRGPVALERLRWGPAGVTALLRPAGDGPLTVELPAGLRLDAVTGGRVVEQTPTAVTAEVAAGEALALEALPPAR